MDLTIVIKNIPDEPYEGSWNDIEKFFKNTSGVEIKRSDLLTVDFNKIHSFDQLYKTISFAITENAFQNSSLDEVNPR